MEIDRIKHFRTVFEIGSVRRASEILHITPGALSKSIKVLESEIDETLFVPQGRNIIPSNFGRRFYQLTDELLAAHSKLQSTLDARPTKEVFTIATWEVFSSYFISYFVNHSKLTASLKVIERTPNLVEESILNGQADVGITYAPVPHPDIEFIKVADAEYGVFSKKNCFRNDRIDEIPFAVPITVFPESPTGVKTLDNWPAEIKRNIAYEFELLETALDLARHGKAAIFCPKFVVELQNKTLDSKYSLHPITTIPSPKVKKTVYLAKKKSSVIDGNLKALKDCLKKLLY